MCHSYVWSTLLINFCVCSCLPGCYFSREDLCSLFAAQADASRWFSWHDRLFVHNPRALLCVKVILVPRLFSSLFTAFCTLFHRRAATWDHSRPRRRDSERYSFFCDGRKANMAVQWSRWPSYCVFVNDTGLTKRCILSCILLCLWGVEVTVLRLLNMFRWTDRTRHLPELVNSCSLFLCPKNWDILLFRIAWPISFWGSLGDVVSIITRVNTACTLTENHQDARVSGPTRTVNDQFSATAAVMWPRCFGRVGVGMHRLFHTHTIITRIVSRIR